MRALWRVAKSAPSQGRKRVPAEETAPRATVTQFSSSTKVIRFVTRAQSVCPYRRSALQGGFSLGVPFSGAATLSRATASVSTTRARLTESIGQRARDRLTCAIETKGRALRTLGSARAAAFGVVIEIATSDARTTHASRTASPWTK